MIMFRRHRRLNALDLGLWPGFDFPERFSCLAAKKVAIVAASTTSQCNIPANLQ